MALTVKEVENARLPKTKHAKLYPDGKSLYLRVAPTGAKSWIYAYRDKTTRQSRQIGLGSFPEVSLAEARGRAAACRDQRGAGVDPLQQKRGEVVRRAGIPTFEELAGDYITEVLLAAPKPPSSSTITEWRATLRLHVFPALGAMRVDQIEPEHVARALRKVWGTNKSADRILDRVRRVLDRAKALKCRADNPATWDIQQNLLGKIDKAENHHGALDWRELPAFMARLRKLDDMASRVIEFVILTAARAGDVMGGKDKAPMCWGNIDIPNRLWNIPAPKAGVRHVVPLSDRALELLPENLPFVLGHHHALIDRVKQLGGDSLTLHGLRSTFRDWCAENGVEDRLAEIALAHRLVDATERAYNRTNRVAARVPLMQRWSDFCAGESKIVELRRR
jgi:integrase